MKSAVRKSSRRLVGKVGEAGKAVRPVLATALSVAVLAGAVACGTDGGDKDDKGAHGAGAKARSGQVVQAAGAAPKAEEGGAVKFEFEQGCKKVKAALEGFLKKGLDSIGCWDSAKLPEPEVKTASEIESQAGRQCRAQPGRWFYTRTDACGRVSLTYTVIDLKTKRTTGRAVFTATQEIQLDPKEHNGKTSIKEGLWHTENTLRLDAASGSARGLRASWKTACAGGACAADKAWSGSVPISKGRVLDGATSHVWKGAAPVQSFGVKNTVTILGAGQVLISPAWFTPPMKIRCDRTFGDARYPSGKNVGCVFPQAVPTMKLPLRNAGQANVAWSMRNLKGHWGWQGRGKPLTRLADEGKSDANRNKICHDGTFKADPQVPDDSCDEYPFAKTRQSGGQRNLAGKDCAEIRPHKETSGKRKGQWTIYYVGNVTPSSECTIGHVPNKQNDSVGGSLSGFYQKQRVIDGEKFWISVG